MNKNSDCLLKINEMRHSLTPKERKLADYILEHSESIINMKIDDVASSCGISVSTVVRLCRGLGYSGYKDLCRNLYGSIVSNPSPTIIDDIHPGDAPGTVLRNVCLSNIKAIENTMEINDADEFAKAVQLLCGAERIDFYGTGCSALIAGIASMKFSWLNKISISHVEPLTQLLSAATLKPSDVAVLFSYNGESPATINLAREIKKRKTPIVSVSRYGKTPLSELADIRLYTVSSENMTRIGVMSARNAQLAIVNSLYFATCSQIYYQVKAHYKLNQEITDHLFHRVKDE